MAGCPYFRDGHSTLFSVNSDAVMLLVARSDLGFNRLTGTLPELLVANHPLLLTLQLDANRFSGSLPPHWGHNRVCER